MIHFHHDIAAAEKLALDVELGDGRPIGIALDARADLGILQHVHAVIGHGQMVENGDGAAGEATLREQRAAFHEQHDVMGAHDFGDTAVDVGHGWILSGRC